MGKPEHKHKWGDRPAIKNGNAYYSKRSDRDIDDRVWIKADIYVCACGAFLAKPKHRGMRESIAFMEQ